MNAYIYQADIYCEDCGQEIIEAKRSAWRKQAEEQITAVAQDLESRFGLDPDKWSKFFKALENCAFRKLAIDSSDESSYDSDEFPKGPYGDGGGEADCPQHCASCREFLENPLTSDGLKYVQESYKPLYDSFYNITREEPGEYSDETQARLDALEETEPAVYQQLTVLRPFEMTESEMKAQLDAMEDEA